jgi:hypothetical protein
VSTFEQLINTGDCFTQVSLYQLLREDGRVFIFVHKILAGAGKGSFMAHPTHLVGRHKTNMLVLENHAPKPSEIALQESKGYPPKTWPTFNRSKQIIYDLPVRF